MRWSLINHYSPSGPAELQEGGLNGPNQPLSSVGEIQAWKSHKKVNFTLNIIWLSRWMMRRISAQFRSKHHCRYSPNSLQEQLDWQNSCINSESRCLSVCQTHPVKAEVMISPPTPTQWHQGIGAVDRQFVQWNPPSQRSHMSSALRRTRAKRDPRQ